MPEQTRISWLAFAILLVGALALVVAIVWPLWKPLFMAVVLAGVLDGVNDRLARRLGDRRRLAASLVTVGLVLLVLMPIAALVVAGIQQAMEAYGFVRDALARGGLEGLAAELPDAIEGPVRAIAAALPGGTPELASGGRVAAGVIGDLLRLVSNALFGLVMFLVALYALLVDGRRLLAWIQSWSPLPWGEVRELLHEFRLVSRSVVGTSVVTSALQGLAAGIGYAIAGVPNPIFFGLLTFFSSFLPSVGTALVAVPLVGLLFILGQTWQAVFLLAWSAVVVGLVDNLVKPYLIQGRVDMHGIVVFFSLIGGAIAFGAVGLILGPLAVAFLLAVVRYGQRNLGTETGGGAATSGPASPAGSDDPA